jgi:hypothetical protein
MAIIQGFRKIKNRDLVETEEAVVPPGDQYHVPPARECSFCGQPPDAFWVEKEIVGVCRPCAIRILPVLFADAVAVASTGPGHPAEFLAMFEKSYWRGVALGLARLARSNDGPLNYDE